MDSIIDRIIELKGNDSTSSMAKKLGVPQTSLSNYLLGKNKVTVELLKLISVKYNVSIDWLVGVSSTKNSSAVADDNTMCMKCQEKDEQIRQLTVAVERLSQFLNKN